MQSADRPTRRMRELIARPGCIRSVGVHDVMTAVIMENAGFEMVFVGGFGTTASLYGLPDLNFLGIGEMADAVRRTAHRLAIPVVADGDTGHGDLHNVLRCVSEFENAGAAGVILEDQVFPKRCGHFEGKRVIAKAEMIEKLKVAARARSDPDFLLVARTDAREPLGLDEAIDRINGYCEAGADVAFIEAPRSMAEIETIAERVPHPKLINMLAFGRTPIAPASVLESMGYKIVVAPIASLLLMVRALKELATVFLRDGHTESLTGKMATFDEVKAILGVDRFLDLADEVRSAGPPGGPGS